MEGDGFVTDGRRLELVDDSVADEMDATVQMNELENKIKVAERRLAKVKEKKKVLLAKRLESRGGVHNRLFKITIKVDRMEKQLASLKQEYLALGENANLVAY